LLSLGQKKSSLFSLLFFSLSINQLEQHLLLLHSLALRSVVSRRFSLGGERRKENKDNGSFSTEMKSSQPVLTLSQLTHRHEDLLAEAEQVLSQSESTATVEWDHCEPFAFTFFLFYFCHSFSFSFSFSLFCS